MGTKAVSRREWLSQAAAGVALVAGAGALLAACKSGGGGGFTCTDTTGLSEADVATRTANGYIDTSTTANQHCSNCALYTAAAAGSCGGCTVVKGPIHPDGWCRIWVTAG